MTLTVQQLDSNLERNFLTLQEMADDLKSAIDGPHIGCICDHEGHCVYHATLAQYLYNINQNINMAVQSLGKR
jgi:hypothetical protein